MKPPNIVRLQTASRSFGRRMLSRSLLLTLATAVGCVSIAEETNVNVWSHEDRTFIAIDRPTKDVNFNWHGGGWVNGVSRFKITIPRFKDRVSVTEILLSRGTGEEQISLGPKSQLELAGATTCQVVVDLYDLQGLPHVLNGVYNSSGMWCRR